MIAMARAPGQSGPAAGRYRKIDLCWLIAVASRAPGRLPRFDQKIESTTCVNQPLVARRSGGRSLELVTNA